MTRLAKILIAEDDHTIAHVVERVLEDTQLYRVSWVTDGDSVLEAVAEEMPDLVLLDLMMPEAEMDLGSVTFLRTTPQRYPDLHHDRTLDEQNLHQTARDARGRRHSSETISSCCAESWFVRLQFQRSHSRDSKRT